MTEESLESLLDQFASGDSGAAKRLFAACEPYLREVVRRRLPHWLRPRFDSMDIVQSVWADVLRGQRGGTWRFEDLGRFEAFLAHVARCRLTDKCRKHQDALERERGLEQVPTSEAPGCPLPPALEELEADELFERMLQVCAPEHQELLRLKRQFLSMEELTARTGFHPGSIRRILRNLARKLALEQNGEAHDG
ncbi:MAG: sigma-70 family RNA polymerase sigma factor [Gemmataceae bacterium]